MMETVIPFTQYLLPNGRQRPVEIEVDSATAAVAHKILALGRYRFECEMLRTGEVSLTTFDTKEEVNIVIEVCPNGSEVPEAVNKMINAAWSYITGIKPKAIS